MENKVFKENIDSLFNGMETFLSSKTIVGDPIHIDDTIIIPLVDVSFGVGAGALLGEKKNNGGGGMGGKMTPSAVIVIHNGNTRLINVSTHSGMDKILDMVPDFVDRFSDKISDKKENKARTAAANDIKKKVDDSIESATE